MSARTLYRVAAGTFVLFAAGHTFGFLRFRPPTAEAEAVRQAMANVHFQAGGATFTYGGFYLGFGLYVSLYLLFSAFLAWHLGNVAHAAPRAVGKLGWIFCAVQAASLILDVNYFSIAPVVLTVLVTACLAAAALRVTPAPRGLAAAPAGQLPRA